MIIEAKAETLGDSNDYGPREIRKKVIVPTLRIYQLGRIRGDDVPPLEEGEFHIRGYDPLVREMLPGHFARVEFSKVQSERHYAPSLPYLVPLKPRFNDLGYDPFATILLDDGLLGSGRFFRFRPDIYEGQILDMLFGHHLKN